MSPLDELKAFMKDTKQRERECGELLKSHFSKVLLPPLELLTFTGAELNMDPGRADIVVISSKHLPDGATRAVAHVWELKAPQCVAFRWDTEGRASPTDDLFAAENQLLHYFHHLTQSGSFKARWNIASDAQVRIGGIIIGRRETFASGKPGKGADEQMRGLARTALDVRERYFYKHDGLRLYTWDDVVELAELPVQGHSAVVV